MKGLFILYMFQDTSLSWFGEMSVLEWLVIIGMSLIVQAIPYFIYLAGLRSHLEHNRNPATLRWFCASIGATLAFGCCLLFFRQTQSWIVFGGLFIILLILSGILFISGKKSITA